MSQIGILLVKVLVVAGIGAFFRVSRGWLRLEDRRFLPILVSRRILGAITVTKKSWGQYFSPAEFTRLTAFADYASISIDMRLTYLEVLEKRQIEHEMGIAAEIQQKLISFETPTLAQAQIAVLSVPAHGVNGDCFHLLPLGDGNRNRTHCFVEQDFEKMEQYVSWRTEASDDIDGGNALFAAMEYWDGGVVFTAERNCVAVLKRFPRRSRGMELPPD